MKQAQARMFHTHVSSNKCMMRGMMLMLMKQKIQFVEAKCLGRYNNL
jgi:hypothetical protein